jgi:DNA-binding MarR family transcriptional regulator
MSAGALAAAAEAAPSGVAPPESKARLRLWLRLLTCSGLIERAVRRRLRDELSVTLPRFDLMAALERAPDGLTMGELSAHLKVSNGNVTGVVERLVQEGLVERAALPTDRRTIRVALTAAGRSAFAVMAQRHAEWIDRLLGDLDEAEIERLMALLGRLRQAVERELGKEER